MLLSIAITFGVYTACTCALKSLENIAIKSCFEYKSKSGFGVHFQDYHKHLIAVRIYPVNTKYYDRKIDDINIIQNNSLFSEQWDLIYFRRCVKYEPCSNYSPKSLD